MASRKTILCEEKLRVNFNAFKFFIRYLDQVEVQYAFYEDAPENI